MEEYQKKICRPLFTIIFRPEMLKFHPYSVLTGDTMVGFVIFCVLKGTKTIMKICNPKLFFIGSRGTQSPIAETFFWLLAVCCGLWIYKGRCGLMASRLVRWCQRNCSQSSETHFYEWWKVIFEKRAVVI